MSNDKSDALEAGSDAHVRPTHRSRRWRRIVLLVLTVPIAWVTLFIVGPLPFLIIATMVMVIDRFLDRHRSRARRADMRDRRHRALDHAVRNGGPSDRAPSRHKIPDPNEAEHALYGNRMAGLIRGAWPHGRI